MPAAELEPEADVDVGAEGVGLAGLGGPVGVRRARRRRRPGSRSSCATALVERAEAARLADGDAPAGEAGGAPAEALELTHAGDGHGARCGPGRAGPARRPCRARRCRR